MSDQYETYETYSRSAGNRAPRLETEPGEPTTIIQRVPTTRVIAAPGPPVRTRTVSHNQDVVAVAMAASQLIWTIVWSVVIIVLLVVLLQALHVYVHLF